MPGQLLNNKLFIPTLRPNAIVRSRLLARFAPLATGPAVLALVSAPAGFGKTTLLAAWTAEHPIPACWLSLDEGDNDPSRFLTYLVAAVTAVMPQAGHEALAMLQSPQPPSPQGILTTLINDIDNLGQPLAVILDDYHVISSQPIHDAMTFLLDHLPALLRLVICTRADPLGLPLARLRARGQLIELRAADLRFSDDEAADFLRQVMGLTLSPEDVAGLAERTEGWIAGLQMAALAMQDRQDVTAFARALSGNQRYILDYLVEEVLNRQPAPLQTFLLNTSILDRMCGELCDALISNPQSPILSDAILRHFDRANLFIVALDDEQHWYRYHHLFADLLRTRLQQTHPRHVDELHRRAARWFEQNGMEDDAIQHALAAHDAEYAAELLEQYGYAILTRGQLTTYLQWLRAIPESVATSRPRLSVLAALAHNFAGQWERIEPLLQQAEQQLPADDQPPITREIRGIIAVLRAHQAEMRGDLPLAISLAQDADRWLPDDALLMRTLIPFTLARAHRARGELEQAASSAAEIVRIGWAIDNVWTIAVGTTTWVGILRVQGRLRAAAELLDNAAQYATKRGSRNFGTLSGIDTGTADILREWNDLEPAQRHVESAIERLRYWANPTDLAWAYSVLARIHMARVDLDAAEQTLQQADQVRKQQRIFPQIDIHVDTDWVRLWLARGDVERAARWSEESGSQPLPALNLDTELVRMAQARVLMAQGKWDEAAHGLAAMTREAETGCRNGRLIEILALTARVQHGRGDLFSALAALHRCLALAQPEGYMRVFLDEGESMRLMLNHAREHSISPDAADMIEYVDRLLAAFAPSTRTPSIAVPPSPAGVDALSEREIEVLRLLAAGLSNSQIAKRLFLTTGTVKSHVHNIYGKLNAQNRAQAVALAQNYKLL